MGLRNKRVLLGWMWDAWPLTNLPWLIACWYCSMAVLTASLAACATSGATALARLVKAVSFFRICCGLMEVVPASWFCCGVATAHHGNNQRGSVVGSHRHTLATTYDTLLLTRGGISHRWHITLLTWTPMTP